MVTERRQSPRCKPLGLVYLSLASDNGGIVLDASEDGLQFQAVAPVEHDDGPTPLWFTLNPTGRIETIGEIVWTDESKKTGGLRFTNLEAEARLNIRKWLEQNGSPLPVRSYAPPIPIASSKSAVIEEPPEQHEEPAPPRMPPAREIEVEDVSETTHSELTLSAMPVPAIVSPVIEPRPDIGPASDASELEKLTARESIHSATPAAAVVPPAFEPRPDIRPTLDASELEKLAAREFIQPVAPAAAIVPPAFEPRPDVRPSLDASELAELAAREFIHPVAPPPAIPQRVSVTPPLETKKEEPVVLPLFSFDAPAPAAAYSGNESEEILREIASAAKHRLDDDAPVHFYSQPVVEFPAPISSPAPAGPPQQYQSRDGISVRTSDYSEPWRPAFATTAGAMHRRDGVSRLAALLVRAGVPSDLVRDVEIMIVVFALVVATGAGLIIFHRQVGAGVQWLGQNVTSNNIEPTAKPAAVDPAPPDSKLSPLLQPPPETHSSAPVAAKRRPKPAAVVGTLPAPTIYVADPNAPTPAPALPPDTGDTELASALQYLRGSGGSTEVTNVGVKWLWASVEKGNTKAAIILADLYVWGRGVPQNCDQARVLLAAAAKRASAEAAQRLQDMDADGCASGAKAPTH
ncbi:MAG: PilZ domain-containing protein [Candidatus Acidiferrales bacterium]